MASTTKLHQAALHAFEKVPDLYLILSPELQILTASDAYLQATRTVREKIAGRQLSEVLSDNLIGIEASVQQKISYSLQQVLRTKQSHRMERQPHESADGTKPCDKTLKYWLILNSPVLDDKGKILYIIHKLEDVPEEGFAQKIDVPEDLLRATEEVANLGSYELDVATMSIRFSDGLYRLFGEEPQSFEPSLAYIDGRSHPDDVPVVKGILEQAIRQKQSYEYTRRIYRPDGALRILQARGNVVCNTSGQPVKLIGLVHDATDQLQAEQELKQSRELLKTTIDSSLDMIQVFESVRNDSGQIIDFKWILNNQTSAEIYGDVVGKNLLEHNPGVVAAGIFDTFKRVVKTGEPDQTERHYVHEQFDGWFYQSTVRLGDGVATTTKNITKRKKAEQALLQSKNMLQGILDAPNVGMAVYKAVRDDQGNILDFVHEFINKRTLEVLGNHDMTNKLLSDHGEAGSKQITVFSEVLETGIVNSYVIQRELLGANRWIKISNARLDSERLVHVWEDVTEQKEKEQELLRLKDEIAQRATDKYRTLFDSIEEGLAICSQIRNEDGEIVDFRFEELNHALEWHTGLERRSIMGRKLSEVFPESDAKKWIQLYSKAANHGKPVTFEEYTDMLEGWFAVSVYPKDKELFIFYRDITERKQRELHQDFLLKFSDKLRAEPNPDAVAKCAIQLLIKQLKLDRSYITTYHLDDNRADLDYQIGNDTVPPLPDHFILSDYPEAFKMIFGGTVVIEDELERQGLSEAEIRNSGKLGMRAMVAATLRKENHPMWSMVAISSRPRHWTRNEIILVQEVAERTWTAIERARTEEALVKSEEKYRTLFDSMDEGYCIIQMIYDDASNPIDFRYLQVNQAFERNTGLHEAEGKTIRELAPDIEPKWMEIYNQVAKTGEPLRFEEASEALHHIFSLYAFRIGDPSEYKVAVIFSDITKQTKAQEALRASEEQFRLFVTASSDIIYKMDADWSRMQMLTGKDFLLDTREPIDSWVDVYIPQVDRAIVEAAIKEAILTKTAFELEHRVNKANGTIGWISSRAIPVLDEQGNIKEWFGTATDITLRKLAEQQLNHLNMTLEQQVAERTHELNESKLFAEQITEATPDFIMIFNLLTNKVEFVNQRPYAGNHDRFHETMQIGYDQLMSRSHPEDRQKLHEFIDRFRTASDQEAYTLEYRVEQDGKLIWYRTRGKVFRHDETGKPTHFISVVQDISDLKQLEQENLQMRLEQQRTNLLAILDAQEEERRRISEGLHNGVGQILYTAKLHLSHYLSQQPKKAGSEVPIRHVDQILDEAIRQTRGLSHQLAPALLEQFGLETAFKEIGNMLSSPSLRIQCLAINLPEQLDKHLQTVVYRVAQEMANNIIRHSNATEASLLLRVQRQNLVLIAEDNGRGFDLSMSSRKGIGLSSIKNRVELLNGTFSINTAPGQGTQVKITLPL